LTPGVVPTKKVASRFLLSYTESAMKKIIVILAICMLAPAAVRAAGDCKYTLDPASVQIHWTAFKTKQKVAVNGSFAGVDVKGAQESTKGVSQLLSGLTGEITVRDEKIIQTGNPGRDLTLFQHFFKYLTKDGLLKASIRTAKGDKREGSFELLLNMNGRNRPIPMHYRRTLEGEFEATGNLDVLDFNLSSALEDLHKTCEVLHTGTDGVSKTWSQVVLKLRSRIAENCGT
jgi:hypothetical protein